ncbi:MAG: hypothetical protein HC794_03270 [Nitrospiraceae bacterium]|nr:hypothetical protein [Nitrospiraceae bacterium]
MLVASRFERETWLARGIEFETIEVVEDARLEGLREDLTEYATAEVA